jgi:hypothetical protein
MEARSKTRTAGAEAFVAALVIQYDDSCRVVVVVVVSGGGGVVGALEHQV